MEQNLQMNSGKDHSLKMKLSYESQKEFIQMIITALTRTNSVIDIINCLDHLLDRLGLPFAELINNDFLISILVSIYSELDEKNEAHKGIRSILTKCIGIFNFEERENSSIPLILEAAEGMGLSASSLQKFPTDLNSIQRRFYMHYQVKVDCEFLKQFIESTDEIDHTNIEHILQRIREVINDNGEENYEPYVYDYFQEKAKVLIDYEDYFVKFIQGNNKPRDIIVQPNLPSVKQQEDQVSNTSVIKCKDELKKRTFFFYGENILIDEGLDIEYKNYQWPLSKYLIETLKNQMCAFLNTKGGRIYIGISDDKIVKGVQMGSKNRDLVRNELVNYTTGFYPKCRTYKIDVHFLPVRRREKEGISNPNLFVIKIIVKQGDTSKLYSTQDKSYISFIRMPGQCVQLTCSEIHEEILRRSTNPAKQVDEVEFSDVQPDLVLEYHSVKIEEKSSNNKHYNNKVNDEYSVLGKIIKESYKTIPTVAVYNIPRNAYESEIAELFKLFKPVNKRIFITKEGRSTGWAYFNFSTKTEAEEMIAKMNGVIFKGSILSVRMKQ